ncbi:MAG TPA: hypothetical protein VMU21_03290 [Thermodesulfovibrionales bacterium]|nr:hypothetical protein [Thermodesulfovibrionales bacterium]
MMIYADRFAGLFTVKTFWITSLLIVEMLFFSANCATIPEQGDLKASLKESAEKYWKMRMDEKYEDTYKMEDKEGLPPFEAYLQKVKAMRRFAVAKYTITNESVEGEKGTVTVYLEVMLSAPRPIPSGFGDAWIYRNGRWRHVLPQEVHK